jgi:hypothetical protein
MGTLVSGWVQLKKRGREEEEEEEEDGVRKRDVG